MILGSPVSVAIHPLEDHSNVRERTGVLSIEPSGREEGIYRELEGTAVPQPPPGINPSIH
eukprot:756197-Hanusia_phi.AAC.1